MNWCLRTIGAAVLVAGVPLVSAQQDEHGKTSFEVSAVFQQSCVQCHGEAQQMAGLDLRSREALLKGGQSGAAIVPGDAKASTLYLRVTGAKQPAMPLGGALAPEQIEAIRRWIEQGAPWVAESNHVQPGSRPAGSKRGITEEDRQWWAFQKPVRHPVPEVADSRWARNPIDAFVQRKREEKGLTRHLMAPARRCTSLSGWRMVWQV